MLPHNNGESVIILIKNASAAGCCSFDKVVRKVAKEKLMGAFYENHLINPFRSSTGSSKD